MGACTAPGPAHAFHFCFSNSCWKKKSCTHSHMNQSHLRSRAPTVGTRGAGGATTWMTLAVVLAARAASTFALVVFPDTDAPDTTLHGTRAGLAVLGGLAPGEKTQRAGCIPTSHVRLLAHGRILVSLVGRDTAKSVGGDEYYVAIMDGHREVAVAVTHDMGNGRYRLHFDRVEVPGPQKPRPPRGYKLRVILQYTCGAGRLDPPVKHGWETSGALNTAIPAQVAGWASLHTLVPPMPPDHSASRIDLSAFDAIVAIGDSTVREFRPRPDVVARMRPSLRFHQLSFLLSRRTSIECGTTAKLARQVQGGRGERQLVIFGGGTWDVMTEYGSKMALEQTALADYEEGLALCLRAVRQAFPNATVVLKSLEALHPHRVDCASLESQEQVRACACMCVHVTA